MASRNRQSGSDVPARTAAIAERRRNVLVDAGAGTGKTSLVVERFVDMVAPVGGAAPIPIERLAAITFTRKAAGDLRLRIRERLRIYAHETEPIVENSRGGRRGRGWGRARGRGAGGGRRRRRRYRGGRRGGRRGRAAAVPKGEPCRESHDQDQGDRDPVGERAR